MKVDARRARARELGTVARLAALALDDRSHQRGGAMLERLDPRPPITEADIEDSNVLVVLGSLDEVVFGFAHARRVDDVAVLYDLFVEVPARQIGIGEALLEAVLSWSREQSLVGIDSVVLPGNRDGKNFFERFGLVARAIVVYREL